MLGLLRNMCDVGIGRGENAFRSGLKVGIISRSVRHKSMFSGSTHENSPLTFSSIAESISKSEQDISNVINPLSRGGNERASNDDAKKTIGRAHEVPVKYILSCVFGKNNSHFTYSAVVEDVNYLRNNPKLSYNEAFLYYLKLPQKVKFSVSTGCLGFRKAARGEYEASFQTATKVFQMIQERKLLNKDIEVVMRDFGKGRAAFIAALNGKEGNAVRKNIIRVSDKTALKFGGVRSPRVRRL